MPRRRQEGALRVQRAHVWTADAEWRWRRALRLLFEARAGAGETEGGRW